MADAFDRFECFKCNKSFEKDEGGLCPYCHSDVLVDKAERKNLNQGGTKNDSWKKRDVGI